MTADDVIRALRVRHPDLSGEWVTYSECWRIDFFAMRCWRSAPGYQRVGYEVKVSRADFLAELRRPEKREEALSVVHEFYFAMPPGLCSAGEVPGECGLVHVFENGRHRVVKQAPLRTPRAFRNEEIIYLARFPLYREGIAEMAAELARYRWQEREDERRRQRLDGWAKLDARPALF